MFNKFLAMMCIKNLVETSQNKFTLHFTCPSAFPSNHVPLTRYLLNCYTIDYVKNETKGTKLLNLRSLCKLCRKSDLQK